MACVFFHTGKFLWGLAVERVTFYPSVAFISFMNAGQLSSCSFCSLSVSALYLSS